MRIKQMVLSEEEMTCDSPIREFINEIIKI